LRNKIKRIGEIRIGRHKQKNTSTDKIRERREGSTKCEPRKGEKSGKWHVLTYNAKV
jgi:hypothetical protein